MNLERFQDDTRRRLEQHLNGLMSHAPSPRLREAMRYSLLGGGKRLRPLLVRATAHSLGVTGDTWLHPAAALEMIHAYSLIHDDLPAMDNDDLRRGQPTNHRAFDEATAILAGDALQSLAFEHLTDTPDLTDSARLSMVRILAHHAGQAGMVGGQMLDLQAEGQDLNQTDLAAIHRLKTGALIESALKLGALCAHSVDDNTLGYLATFGQALGLAFQITDDILDVTTDTAILGKPQGSDAARDKSTYVRLLGLDEARVEARRQIDCAKSALNTLALDKNSPLHRLADYVLERDH
ncbi:polyprenyl synthetase family protein [Saccharospirillum salsuginis]|uniref:(2E,6E)-farnesyl diphosphate synthase n=1 Tax=Saccharospirillum salsuginis TaxID=418750 RepID=A0A918K0T6_9GAMM|nr:farnesyl diphosphate synthase [Saccharospirillum salsuginis]GGX41579.1 (2E,6E)-farnesyl diphosphate synthase [Saccharospirillum salsuginis]